MALKKVLIVGGGSAGWITAAYMDAVLNGQHRKAVDITLVESANIGRIGVGEATVPSLRDTMRTIGVPEREFMRATDATFKQAIEFVDWLEPGSSYYHPFDRRPAGRLDRSALRWLTSDRSVPYAHTVSAQPALCEAGLAPKFLDTGDYGGPISYAYHVDAEKLGDFLCELATGRGVTRVIDDVVQVNRKDNGDIDAVATAGGHHLAADLFIDCTGFASILLGKQLKVGFEDYSQWLLCDRAVAMRIPHEVVDPGKRRPFTRSTALSCGWVWDIGLADRRGTGYVYSSAFLDEAQAEAELRAYAGPECSQLEARQLRFRVGRAKKAWARNCVGIGLSSGFIEPLESTGIFLVELAVATLCEYFPFGGDMDLFSTRFNDIIQARYEEILDFVVLHYCLTRREDSRFWQEVQKPERIPDRLRELLALWNNKTPSLSDFHDSLQLFNHTPYEYVLYGMDFQKERTAHVPPGQLPAPRIPESIERTVRDAVQKLPGHDAWLTTNLGSRYAG